jgi:hypothetical protein
MDAEQITFTANRLRSMTTFVLATMVGVLGLWALFAHPVSGAIILIVAAIPAVVSLPTAISPRKVYVQLDSTGFEVASRRDKDRIQWHDVAEFRRGFYNDRPVIEIEYAPGFAQRRGLRYSEAETIGRIFDRYNAPLPHILDKLIEWRSRYG